MEGKKNATCTLCQYSEQVNPHNTTMPQPPILSVFFQLSVPDKTVGCPVKDQSNRISSLLVYVHLVLTLQFFLVKTPSLPLLIFWPAAPLPLSTTSGHSCPRRLLPQGLLHGLFATFLPAATAPPASLVAAEGSAAHAWERCCRRLIRTQQETSGLHSVTICQNQASSGGGPTQSKQSFTARFQTTR